MERGTLASGSDLTWILPHWHSCLLSVPLGDVLVGDVCLGAHIWARASVNGWSLWMKTPLPGLQTGGEIILLKWRIPHPQHPSLTRPPTLVGANRNESHQWTIWMKCTVVATWWMTTLCSMEQTGSDRSIVRMDQGICKHTNRHTPSFLLSSGIRKNVWLLVSSQRDGESKCQLSLLLFVHIPFRNRVEWICWLATYSASVCEWKWQWVTQGALDDDP